MRNHLLPISTNVLYLGLPAEGLTVKLFKLENEIWVDLNQIGVTDKDGRFEGFQVINNFIFGTYKLHFETNEFLRRFNVESIYPYVEVKEVIF
jgi:5-hydroxyisourate hydrolase-like protein (transthyretin family)